MERVGIFVYRMWHTGSSFVPCELESKVRRALERVPIDWAEEMLTQILSLLDEPQKIHAYIVDKIIAQREYWRSKPGLKRLSVHPEYG